MTPLVAWRAAIAIAGIVVFMWGAKTQNRLVSWVGIACLIVALALRFVGRSKPR